MKRWGKRIGAIKGDNRGATIVVVLVTMTFVVVLASVLLYMSLVNIRMKQMDREGKAAFYSAESVMNEIRAGVEVLVSRAIEQAYTQVLVSYNITSEEEQAQRFSQLFYDHFRQSAIGPESGAVPLFDMAAMTYDAPLLLQFVSRPDGVSLDGSQGVYEFDPDNLPGGLRLCGIRVRYAAKGYEMTVTTDLLVSPPELPYIASVVSQTSVPDYAIIAREAIDRAGYGTAGITGSAYAGRVDVGANSSLVVRGAPSFITAGAVTVSGGGKMTVDVSSSLWARDIVLESGGEIATEGDAYIANDLNLKGNSARAVLAGRYFGFGASADDPDDSSSIVINGRHTVLDMSHLSSLLLAGHSFINYASGANSYVLMGESVSVKSNQLAYLLPESSLRPGITNPYEYTGSPSNAALAAACIQLDSALSGYGITNATEHIQYIRKPVGQKNLVYFCLKLTPDNANRYYESYFAANSESIGKYVDIYSDGLLMSSGTTKNISGSAFTFEPGPSGGVGTLGPLIPATGVASVEAGIQEIAASYRNLRVTLSRRESGAEATPYERFVNTVQLGAAPAGARLFPEDDPLNARAVVVNSGYTIGAGTPSSVRVVIASGDVTVARDFKGLIISGGRVTLSQGVTVSADRVGVADALLALTVEGAGGQYEYYCLNPQYISPLNVHSDGTHAHGIWDVNKLVGYDNWSKN